MAIVFRQEFVYLDILKHPENMNTAEVPGAGLLVWMEVRSMKSNYVILISLRQWDTSLYW